MLEIGVVGLKYRNSTGFVFEQARYLLPLLPIYSLAMVGIACGAGRRLERIAGGALVLIATAHVLFAQLLTLSRYYG